MFRNLLKLFATALLATAAAGAFAQSDVYSAANHDYKVVTIAEDLVQPWSMAWLPGGDMLITEKPGRLRVVRDGSLLPEAIPGVPDVFYEGQGGLRYQPDCDRGYGKTHARTHTRARAVRVRARAYTVYQRKLGQ